MPWNPADLSNRPVVVIVRHPDEDNRIFTYAGTGEPDVIDLDLGGSFDISYPDPDNGPDVRGWIEGREHDITTLPEGHPAREDIQAVIDMVREAFGLDEDNQ